MFRKLRTQLLVTFLGFALLTILLGLVYFGVSSRKNQISYLVKEIMHIELLVLKNTENINNYFTYDTKTADYYNSKKSKNLESYHKLHKEIQIRLSNLKNIQHFYIIDKGSEIIKIKSITDKLHNKIDSITNYIHKEGFKDFGQVGIMREHAHKLESIEQVDMLEILMLRRCEKDYIIRNDREYVNRFNTRIDNYSNKLMKSKIEYSVKNLILRELKLYQANFNKMVSLDSIIGIKENTALKKEIDNLINELLKETNKLTNYCEIYKKQLFTKIKLLSVLSIIIITLLIIILSVYFSKHITGRITILSDAISKYVSGNFTYTEKIPIKKRNDEVGLLVESFEIMRNEINDHFTSLESIVEERTEEIKAQNEQIVSQNNIFKDSLEYAVNIQRALTPQIEFISKNMGDMFVFYRPKDIVSGDFYWYKKIKTSKVNKSVFAVADCTGHGIPGAFMSILGISFLNEAVAKTRVPNSANILEILRSKIIDNLSQQNNEKIITDGMDIALVIIDHNNMKIQYSGAYRNLFLARKNEIIKIYGDKIPIGESFEDEVRNFSFVEKNIEETDTLYMFSDGFADQQGGSKGKKYQIKHLKQLLASNSEKPLFEQEQIIKKEFLTWKGKYPQTDDVLVVGFRVRK